MNLKNITIFMVSGVERHDCGASTITGAVAAPTEAEAVKRFKARFPIRQFVITEVVDRASVEELLSGVVITSP